jgi:hypothetical protein
MAGDRLKQIFAEDQQDWSFQTARLDANPDDVIALLYTQTYHVLACCCKICNVDLFSCK